MIQSGKNKSPEQTSKIIIWKWRNLTTVLTSDLWLFNLSWQGGHALFPAAELGTESER